MKKYKMIFSVLFCLSVLSVWAGQWTYNCGTLSHDTFGWILNASQNGTNLTVTGVSTIPSAPSPLPLGDPMPGYALVSIGDWAFSNCTVLTSLEIGIGVTNIGNIAFQECTSLSHVTIRCNSEAFMQDYTWTDDYGIIHHDRQMRNYMFDGCVY